jgi:hypothetical protein
MTTIGKFIEQAPPSMSKVTVDGSGANPATAPETPQEEGWWKAASPWVHGALGVASFVPGLSIITGGADAAIYAAEGNALEAGIAVASMIPGGKVVTTVGKVAKSAIGAAKGASTASKVVKGAHEAEEMAKAAKTIKEAEEAAAAKLAKEAEEAEKLRKAKEIENAKNGKRPEPNKGKKDVTIKEGKKKPKKEPGPCDHLKQGKGKGPYRGGAHSKTSKPTGDGKDSHHMPADDASPLPTDDGPAIQMHPDDHKMTSSNGNKGKKGIRYRADIGDLLKKGQWREAMLKEIVDIRKISKNIGYPKKYNEAMLEMLEYFKCLEKNSLLP